MHRRIVAMACGLAAALLVAGCSSQENAPKPPASKAEAKQTYGLADCTALLERNYQDKEGHDASGEPACKGLTRKEYLGAVKDVLARHKDDILKRSAQEVAWDSAWEQTKSDQQDLVCERLKDDGAAVVGQEMADATGNDVDEQTDMAQYLLDEKC